MHQAITSGEIDLYAEYTGTSWSVVLKKDGISGDPLRTYLEVARGYREIAASCDLPVGTVRSRLHRARNELKRRLESTELQRSVA